MSLDAADKSTKLASTTLKSKKVQLGSREIKVLNDNKILEGELIKCILKWRNEKKCVTRTIIFQQALIINKYLLGGVGSPYCLKRTKNWYCYGLNKRLKLSIHQVNGVGGELPKDWEKRVKHMVQHVAKSKLPQKKQDRNDWFPFATDDKVANTDHVPTWMEAVGNVYWGFQGDDQRCVVTGGKEKNPFTTQLSILESGKKLKPFVIWKVKRQKQGPLYRKKPSHRRFTIT